MTEWKGSESEQERQILPSGQHLEKEECWCRKQILTELERGLGAESKHSSDKSRTEPNPQGERFQRQYTGSASPKLELRDMDPGWSQGASWQRGYLTPTTHEKLSAWSQSHCRAQEFVSLCIGEGPWYITRKEYPCSIIKGAPGRTSPCRTQDCGLCPQDWRDM